MLGVSDIRASSLDVMARAAAPRTPTRATSRHTWTLRKACALRFPPFTLANQDMLGGQSKKRTLADAGLLTKRDTPVKAMFGNKMEPATEYQVTDTGKKFLVANGANTMAGQEAFCTGKYTVVEVSNFTEPSDMMGVKLSQVNYRYKVEGADEWAKSAGIRANYKNFAEQTQGDIQGKAAVILTNDGWMHERLFKRG